MRALLTGATGFLGSHLAARLVADGHDVHVIVRQTSNLGIFAKIINSITIHAIGELPSAQDRGDDRLRLCSASSSRRYSIPAGVKAMVCWSSARWIQRQLSSGSISSARSHRRQELLVLAKHFGGAADGESESRRRHVRRRGRQASRGANSTAAVRPIR
jgi:NAD(P)-dependent dehydrogenase (short-subunit alcohol dehydrogenase family)